VSGWALAADEDRVIFTAKTRLRLTSSAPASRFWSQAGSLCYERAWAQNEIAGCVAAPRDLLSDINRTAEPLGHATRQNRCYA
jgi:hypothetical protein